MRTMASELEPIAPPGNLTWDYNEMLNSSLTAQSSQGLVWPGGFAASYDPAGTALGAPRSRADPALPAFPRGGEAMLGDTFGYIPLKESERIHIMMYDEANAACAKIKSLEQATADLQEKAVAFMTKRGSIK